MIALANDLLETLEGAFAGGVTKRERNVAASSDPELRAQDVRVSLSRSRGNPQALCDLEV